MSADLLIVLLCLAAAIVMFAVNRPRMDAVALLVIALLPFTGALTVPEALAGFSDPNIVLIAALFVLGAGLVRTGVARALGDWLLRRAGRSEARLVVLLMLVVAALGSVMSSTAVVAIFIPVVLRITQTTGMAAGHLMMPLSAAALSSGMLTLVATTPNLLINSARVQHGSEGFAFFSFTPFGLPILVLCVVYMLVARHWLPAAPPGATLGGAAPSLADWIARYRLAGREHRVRITPGSGLIGRRLADLDLRSRGLNLVSPERVEGRALQLLRPVATTALEAGDVLLLDLFTPTTDIAALCQRHGLEELPLAGAFFGDRTQELGLAEVMVTADSSLVGRSVVAAELRSRPA
jgi:di/tricarboxylate transporter